MDGIVTLKASNIIWWMEVRENCPGVYLNPLINR